MLIVKLFVLLLEFIFIKNNKTNKTMKQIILAIAVTLLSIGAASAETVIWHIGSPDTNSVIATLNTEDSTLIISGSGAIKDYAFASAPFTSNAGQIKTVIIENGVTTIGWNVFYQCRSLTAITIPNSVTIIESYAFAYCSRLASIIIPSSVKTIGNYTFHSCASLNSIVIPDSVNEIGYYAFRNCSSLASVIIPNSVTNIGEYAFADCDALTSIILPNSIKTIRNSTFRNCSNITSVTIPDGITTIGTYAFHYCSALTSIAIPRTVTTISEYAFENCGSLTSVTNYATTPQIINSNVFGTAQNISSDTLYVPAVSYNLYRNADVWKDFGTTLPVQADVTGVAFYDTVLTLAVGGQDTLIAIVIPYYATNYNVTYSSSDTLIAKIDETTGIITGIAEGTATITATIAEGGFTATCKVTVTFSVATQNLQRAGTLKVYPNPTAGVVTVDAATNIEVYNSIGALVWRTNSNRIDLSAQPAGVYLIKADDKTARIIKK
jgi:hypothetical protein